MDRWLSYMVFALFFFGAGGFSQAGGEERHTPYASTQAGPEATASLGDGLWDDACHPAGSLTTRHRAHAKRPSTGQGGQAVRTLVAAGLPATRHASTAVQLTTVAPFRSPKNYYVYALRRILV